MVDARIETEALLTDKPHLESQLEAVLPIDEANDTWTFDDVPLDSGAFGELVSHGIVEETDGEYALADREAVRRALDGESDEQADDEPTASIVESLPEVEIDRVAAAGLVGALALVVLFRLIPIGSVFRGGDVVLSANDPYAYRYLVHEILAQSSNPLDLSVLSSLPPGVAHGEPLMVATLWWVSALLGGESAVGGVLAWYPVVSAVVTGLLVYALTVRVTDDKRAGIAAVALLAVTPGHAFRTGLGFADHHAFDYPWLALTALAVVAVVDRDIRERRTWAWIGVLGVGVAGQMLSWDAGPLLLAPIGLYAIALVPSWVRDGRSPLVAGGALLSGVVLGTLVAVGAHLGLGWHTPAVIVGPVLLSVGIAALLAVGEGARRGGFGARSVAAVEVVGVVVGVVVLRSVVPAFATELERGVEFLLTTEGIAETTSIVSGDLGTFVGPVFLFGLVLFLALGHMGWAVWTSYRRHSPVWLAMGVYAWYFLVLSAIQVRFAGQLALFTALFGGLGFVHLAAWVDLSSVPTPFEAGEESSRVSAEDSDDGELEWPERRQALYAGALGLGVGSLGGLLTPIRHSQLTIDDSMYEAAKFMQDYSDARGWEYPENYVFSQWGDNRFYNWFVNGESRSYRFAQNNFTNFLRSERGEEWYQRLSNKKTAGFIVISARSSNKRSSSSLYNRLYENAGSKTGHYQSIWASKDGKRWVFVPVSGAILTGKVEPQQPVTVKNEVKLNNHSFEYRQETTSTETGWYATRVAQPGEYITPDGTKEVRPSKIKEGRFISEKKNKAHWPMNSGSGRYIFDIEGGHHGEIDEGAWNDGIEGNALQFQGSGGIQTDTEDVSFRDGFTVAAWIKLTDSSTNWPVVIGKGPSPKTKAKEHTFVLRNDKEGPFRFSIVSGGSKYQVTHEISLEEWHFVGLVYDGCQLKAYVDGNLIGRKSIAGELKQNDSPVTIGQMGGENNWFGLIDEVWIYTFPLSQDELRTYYDRKR